MVEKEYSSESTSAVVQEDTVRGDLITDASKNGWGAILSIGEQQQMTWGQFPAEISRESSNYREITAVLFAMRFFSRTFKKEKVECLKIQSDNQTTVYILNRIRAKNKLLFPARKIFSFLTRMKMQVIAQYLPGVENTNADALSRLELSGDYQLERHIFWKGLKDLQIFQTIDMFATEENHLLQAYVTFGQTKGATAQDAFSVSWRDHLPFLHHQYH
jgi:ribonuclease HI